MNQDNDLNYVGHALAYRLALREEDVAQLKFISALHSVNMLQQMVMCGSGALHGLFLHRRLTGSMDFFAPPLAAIRFFDVIKKCDLNITPSHIRTEYIFNPESLVVKDLRIKIRIFPKQVMPFVIINNQVGDNAENISIRSLSLSELIISKMALMFLREDCKDYLDVWLTLQHTKGANSDVIQLLRNRRGIGSSHVPPYPLHTETALKRMQQLKSTWSKTLTPFIESVPEFNQVYDDLGQWLPAISTNS